MKKIYSLLFLALSTVSFGQVFSDDLNYADGALLTANGWTAHSGATNFIDVGASNGLSYAGYSGLTGITGSVEGNAALLDNTGEDVNKAFAAPVTTGTLYYSFLVNVAAASPGYFTHLGSGTTVFAARVFVNNSATPGKINFGISNTSTATYGTTDFDLNTTYLLMVKYDVSTSGVVSLWVMPSGVPATEAAAGTPEATATGGGIASVEGVYLRQYNLSQNITIDGLYVDSGWFGDTPPPTCPLALGTVVKVCDAITEGTDTYTVTIPFTGGGTATYTLNADSGTISGGNPSTDVSGDIVISGVQEGTPLVFTAAGGDCDLTVNVTSPTCTPPPVGVTLPYINQFDYTAGDSLSAQPNWTVVSGLTDEIIVGAGNLDYTGLSSFGNSISFVGGGIDNGINFTGQTTGTIYYSYLLNVSNLDAVTTPGYYSGFGSSNTVFGGTLWINKIDATTYQLGVEVKTATGGNTVTWSADNYQIGETHFVVVGYMFGDNPADDMADLWIDPVVGDAQTVPTVMDTHTGTDLTTADRFIIRQDSDTETGTVQMDALRVGIAWEDVTGSTLSVKDNSIAGLKVYPNPVSNGTFFIETAANAEKAVVIYDVLGKQVLNTTTTTNAVNVSNLTGGVYIVKITEEGNTATRKMVIK